MSSHLNILKLIFVLAVINNCSASTNDNEKEKTNSESKLVQAKFNHSYLSNIIHIPEIQNIISDYLKQWKEFKSFQNPGGLGRLAYSADGKYLASAARRCGRINIWDADDYHLVRTFNTGDTGEISCIKYSSNNQYFASCSKGRLKIWDPITSKLLYLFNISDGATQLEFSNNLDKPNENVISCSTNGGETQIWSIESGKLLHTFKGYRVAFASNGKYLATGHQNNFKILDMNSFKLLHTEHCKYARGIIYPIYSPNGKYLACKSYGSPITIRNADSFELLYELTGHIINIDCITYSLDNRYFASVSADCIRIWDAKTYKLLQVLKNHTFSILSLVFSPDSKYLAAAYADGMIKVWHCDVLI